MSSLEQLMPNWIQRSLSGASWQYRLATWRSRALPDFLIIGAQKSGTGSLYHYLIQHPQLLPSLKKEVHFFDGGLDPAVDNFEKGQAWYRAHFPLKSKLRSHKKTFEASPLYIFSPLAAQRISAFVPKVKIIAVLRNPTERAISHYFHESRKNRESLSIFEALREEEKRLRPILERKDYKNHIFIHHSYKSRGHYRDQIERYLPCRQLLVINSEKLFAEPDNILKQVFEFLGVDTGFAVKDLKPRNVARNKTNVAPEVYDYLDSYFRPHNQALYELTGENYGW